jgi:tetratricopeptide (TPR) repeat protein
MRLFGEAAAAYRRVLLVLTRDSLPQDWATTQHNLGYTLQELGVRTNGAEAIRLLGEAVAAYKQALSIRTREQLPQQWAITQNNLANALQAQGTRADKPEALRLLDEALTAYRQSLLVFTREQTPRLWAMTKHNVGSALQEQGTRADGAEPQRLFREAVAAYNDALLVWTRQQLPQQWAMAQNNLARAYFNLKEWKSAAESYENVLEVHPDFRPAYERARYLEHEVLFNYERAFKLNESWLQRNPNDLAAIAGLAETFFTTGNFDECARRISGILSDARFDEKVKIPLRTIEIARLIALNRSAEVSARMKGLVEAVQNQPSDFRVERSFTGIEHFLAENQQFAADKAWLLQLFAAMGGENRAAILNRLPKN